MDFWAPLKRFRGSTRSEFGSPPPPPSLQGNLNFDPNPGKTPVDGLNLPVFRYLRPEFYYVILVTWFNLGLTYGLSGLCGILSVLEESLGWSLLFFFLKQNKINYLVLFIESLCKVISPYHIIFYYKVINWSKKVIFDNFRVISA